MSPLALNGGVPVRTKPFPAWPIWDEFEESAVLRVIRSGRWGRLDGAETGLFEQEFAAYQQARYGVAVQGGGTALRLALLASGIQAGDEVIVPPYTFIATVTSVIEVNAVPVFADIDPRTHCLSVDAVGKAITPKTRAVLPVHLGGYPADMDALMALADARGLTVIEDAAHAHGAEWRGRRVGGIGHLGAFSFQASKNLNAGEGGVVLTDDEALGRQLHALQNNGRLPTGSRHEFETLGGNVRLTELQAALLRAQLSRLEAQTQRREANRRYLNARLATLPGTACQGRAGDEIRHGNHLYSIRFDPDIWEAPRERILAAVRAEGIPIGPGYATLVYEHPVFTEKRFGPYSGAGAYRADVAENDARCPDAVRISKTTGAWLYQNMLLGDASDMDDIVAALEKVFDGRKALR